MKIKDLLANKLSLSMEIFPPKKEGDHHKLLEIVNDLKSIQPDFISVTYGAGGSTRSLTEEIASEIKNKKNIESMAHLTCVGNTKDQIGEFLDKLKEINIENILALRGDPSQTKTKFIPVKGGFRYASELIEYIKKEKNYFSIATAGYPEKHIEAHSLKKDIEHLKKKIDAGADFIITQLFFNNNHFYQYLEMVRKNGIQVPVIPGIFLISSYKQLNRIKELTCAEIPISLKQKLEKYQASPQELRKIGVEFAVTQSIDLLESKLIAGLHFYIMNRSDMIKTVYQHLKHYFQK